MWITFSLKYIKFRSLQYHYTKQCYLIGLLVNLKDELELFKQRFIYSIYSLAEELLFLSLENCLSAKFVKSPHKL